MSEAQLCNIAPGVHAWIGTSGDSNAGAVESRDGLIVIDAQQNRVLGEKFRDALKAAIGVPIRALVNTHFHLDHIAGNVAFTGTTIVAHNRTRQLIEKELGPAPPQGIEVSDIAAKLRMFFGSNFQELVPEGERQWFIDRVGGSSTLTVLSPTDTFPDKRVYSLNGDVVHLQYWGPAHCDGDLVIYLPRAGVVFMGDLFFNERFPWLGDCDLDGWIAALDRVLAMDMSIVVPGHGLPATRTELRQFRDLLAAMRAAVGRAIKSGWSEEAAVRDVVLTDYTAMQRYKEWMPFNIRAVYRYLRG
ncbi:MAG TPA: MBL fold metallo-hydrolase [Pseudolabrys sp.]|nr:MBL fold metallo-hydrolase [Pseudolabrys sp.]